MDVICLTVSQAQRLRGALHMFHRVTRDGRLEGHEGLRSLQREARLIIELEYTRMLAHASDESLLATTEEGLADCGRRWDTRGSSNVSTAETVVAAWDRLPGQDVLVGGHR